MIATAAALDNVFGRDFRYGAIANTSSWQWDASNVWADSRRPVRS